MDTFQESLAREQRVHADLASLRSRILDILFFASVFSLWLWYSYTLVIAWHFGASTAAVVLLSLSAWGVHQLRRQRFGLASTLLWLTFSGIYALLMAAQATSAAMAVSVLLSVGLATLMGTWASLALLAGTWALGVLAAQFGGSAAPLVATLVSSLLVLGVSWGAAQLATQPLQTALDWAFTGWGQARESLQETRVRRAELYRALRALEEANYRIQRMNQDLIASRHEAEVARAQKALFVRTVSHELRGPLSIVLGFSRLIALQPERYGQPLPETYCADVDAILRNAQHLASLVDDILDMSQMEAERLPIIKEWIDLERDVCAQAVKIVQPLALAKGLEVQTSWLGDLPPLLGDAVRLRQALLNVLKNAIRFTERGAIRVHTARQTEAIVVAVEDTGSGIPAEDLARVFEPFSPAQQGHAEKGSGLGLSISRQLLRLHGGEIVVESTPGQGTTFRFILPLPGAQPLLAGGVQVSQSLVASDRGGVCLLVGVSAAVGRLLARYLGDVRVVVLPQVERLSATLEHLLPSAIITTNELAISVGELMAPMNWQIPVISCGLPQAAVEDRLSNILAYLTKPVSADALLAVVAQVEGENHTKILIVDDEPDAVRLLEGLLQSLPRPYLVRHAFDGQAALGLMEHWTPDLLLIDLLMPGLGGEETILRMRQSPRLSDIPAVVISACDLVEEDATMSTPVAVHSKQPLSLSEGMTLLRLLLQQLVGRG